MAENNNFINVGGRLHSIATGNVLAGTDEIYDDGKGKKQSTINTEIDAILAQHTSVIQGLNSQNYETYAATNQTTAVTDVLPATGSVNTVYRLGNWDGSQFDPSCYTEYSWDGTQYVPISTKTQIDEVFDISAYHASGSILATYADLLAALDSNNGGGVPQSLQRGGMSIKFVCSSDNKYVQYRLMSNTFSTTESDWQGVDNKPTAGSENLVTSGGVEEVTKDTVKLISNNLYDKNKIGVANKYINHTGTLKDLPNAEVSYLIPIKPNTIYAWEKIGGNSNNCYFRFVKQDEITPLKPLNPSTGEEIAYSSTGRSQLFKSPSEAAFAQFTVIFNNTTGIEEIKNVVQLIEKDTLQTSIYYPYKLEIPYDNLPDSLLKEVSDIKSELNNKPDDSDLEVTNNNIESLKDLKVDKYSINLFDKTNTLNADGYWDGKMLADGYHHTHPIRVKANTRYKINSRNTFGISNYAAYVTETGDFISFLNYIEGTGEHNIFNPPHDGYLSFNYGNADTFMACEESKYPSSYTPYNVQIEENVDLSDFQYSKIKSKIEESLIPINESLDSKANLVDEIDKNLFDKSKVINGKYIHDVSGVLKSFEEASISSPIKITPNQVYYLYRGGLSLSSTACRFIDVDGNQLKPLKEDGSEYVSYVVGANAIIKAPANAKYVQFLVKWGSVSAIDVAQLEKGNTFTGYEEYYSKRVLPYVELPKELLKQLDDTEKTEEVINISNSDKIGVFSTSFMNGYAMRNHHHLNHLSMFLDYIIYNYGHSGDDELENLDKLNKDSVWLGVIPPSQWNIKYGIVMHEENSGALKSASSDIIYENSKKLANAIKSLGGIPIFSTEHDADYAYYQGAIQLCNEEGYMFMHWGTLAKKLFNTVFAPFWYNSHPATRTGWMVTNGMLPYLQSLPRPTQCIKLFRVRESIDTTNLQNLVFEDLYTRAQRYVELTCGVSALTQATEKYFDRLDATEKVFENVNDEYQYLQNKQAVSFGNFAMINLILPYTKVGLKKLILYFSGTGVTNVYIQKIRQISNPLPATRYVAFGITQGTNLIQPGDTFAVTGGVYNDNIKGDYTVSGIINGMLVTTTNSSGKTTSGTDTPIITSSDFDVSNVTLSGSYDYPSYDYMSRYKQPLGEWIDVTSEQLEDGGFKLTNYIDTCLNFDSVAILLKGTNISISDIFAKVVGSELKTIHNIPMFKYQKGESLITDSLLDNNTSWEGISDITNYDNTQIISTVSSSYERLPIGITTVKEFQQGQSIRQSILSSVLNNNNEYGEPIKIQIRVIARYFPNYVDSDAKWATSEITEQSFDVARFAIYFGNTSTQTNPTKVAEFNVGAWWNEFIVDTYCTENQLNYIKAICTDKKVQVAKIEVVKIS